MNERELFDATRLRPLWEPSATKEGEPGPRPRAERPIDPPDPAEIALDHMESSVRRELGTRIGPLETYLARVRELVLAQVASKKAEKAASELAEWTAKAEAAAAAAGIDLTEPPPAEGETTSGETAPAEAAPGEPAPAEPGPRKAIKKREGAPTSARAERGEGLGKEYDMAFSAAGQDGMRQDYRRLEDRALDGEDWEESRAREAEYQAEQKQANKDKKGLAFSDYGLGTTLGIGGIADMASAAQQAQRTKADADFMVADEERRQRELAAEKALNPTELQANKATLNEVLDSLENLYRALKLTPA